MKITDVEVFHANAPWRSWLFVRLRTDSGLHGWGEGTTSDRAQAVQGAISHLTRRLIGRDPGQIEAIWRDLYTGWRGGPIVNSAISAIDGALWDIQGKRYGVPVWQLLGGPLRRNVRVYASGMGAHLVVPDDYRRATETIRNAGYKGAKLSPLGPAGERSEAEGLRYAISLVRAVRDAAGPDFEVFVECAERLNARLAIELSHALAEFRPIWMEEPIPAGNNKAMCALRPRLAVPLACGEKLFSRLDYRELLEGGGADFIQPDLTHAGGITEVRKIAAVAETYNVQVAPHNSGGPVSTAMALQIAAVAPTFFVLETRTDEAELRERVGGEAMRIRDGYLELSDAPGLGVEPDLAVLESVPSGDEPIYPWRQFRE
ncbi:MAG: mandelate racemase/muconate lactonizing enzyme family protein [Actinobacteria bacterium]|nr:mandelate racemase/muconate lactonizing enzyme family protein [Actinomycetota bacterium]